MYHGHCCCSTKVYVEFDGNGCLLHIAAKMLSIWECEFVICSDIGSQNHMTVYFTSEGKEHFPSFLPPSLLSFFPSFCLPACLPACLSVCLLHCTVAQWHSAHIIMDERCLSTQSSPWSLREKGLVTGKPAWILILLLGFLQLRQSHLTGICWAWCLSILITPRVWGGGNTEWENI